MPQKQEVKVPNLSSDLEVLEHQYTRMCANKHIKEDLLFYAHRQSYGPDTEFREGERSLALRILRLGGVIE